MWWFALLFVDELAGQADRVRAAMAASLEKQRVSVEQQLKAVASAGHAFAWSSSEAMASPAWPCRPVAARELDQMISEAANQHQLDPALVREVAREESRFYPCAVSPKGAAGLMQLMPQTQMQFAVRDPLDPRASLAAGAQLLKQLVERYQGDLRRVLSAYNAGVARTDRSSGIPEITETQHYVSDILNRITFGLTATAPPEPARLAAPEVGPVGNPD